MTRFHIMVILLLMAAGTYIYSACFGQTEPAQPFTIAWNYDTNGFLETCGCSARQLGGLPRRASMIEQLRAKQPLLAIEGAHFIADSGEFQLFKGEAIVGMLNLMDYDALQFGIREAEHGGEALRSLAAIAEFPCFSTNLQVDGAAWPVSSVVLEIAHNSVAIIGVSQPESVSFALPADIAFADPRQSIDAVLPGLAKDNDLVILCLEGEQTWISGMIEQYADQADLFLAGNRNEATASLNFVSNPPALNNWDHGRFVSVVSVDPLPTGYQITATAIALEDDTPDLELVANYLDETYRPQLKDRFFSRMKVDLEQIYLPPDTCEPCHYEEYRSYTGSDHGHALNTLFKINQLYNPDCMPCHVVYDAALDKLHSMNCVMCHSNITEQHIWDAMDEKVVRPAEPVAENTYEWCAQCHNEEQSTPFKDHWPQYVNAIYHGGDISAAEAAAESMGLDINEHPPE